MKRNPFEIHLYYRNDCENVRYIPMIFQCSLLVVKVMVIAESRMSHLSAHLYHVEHFHWSTSSTNDLSYSLVTFRAAVQYMLNTDFSPLQAPPPGASSEVSNVYPLYTWRTCILGIWEHFLCKGTPMSHRNFLHQNANSNL